MSSFHVSCRARAETTCIPQNYVYTYFGNCVYTFTKMSIYRMAGNSVYTQKGNTYIHNWLANLYTHNKENGYIRNLEHGCVFVWMPDRHHTPPPTTTNHRPTLARHRHAAEPPATTFTRHRWHHGTPCHHRRTLAARCHHRRPPRAAATMPGKRRLLPASFPSGTRFGAGPMRLPTSPRTSPA